VITLSRSLAAYATPEFKTVLKQEIEALDVSQLPLVRGMAGGSVPLEGSVEAMILDIADTGDSILVKAGLFFRSIIAGCACADDPTPENENNEYCEVQFDIDKSTAETTATLLASD